MKSNNNQEILIAKQAAAVIKQNQGQNNKNNPELDFQQNNSQPNVIFGSKVEKENQEQNNSGPNVIFGSKVKDDEIEKLKQKYLPDFVFTTNNDESKSNPDLAFTKNNESSNPDFVFTTNDLEEKKKKLLEDLKNQKDFSDADRENNENKLKKLAEIPVKEKNDYFFFVLVASTALGGPVGFALASIACKNGFQLGGVIGDSSNLNPDQFMKTLGYSLLDVFFYDKNNSKIADPLAVFSQKLNKEFDSGYDKSLATALITGFKSAVELIKEELDSIKEEFYPTKKPTPITAECLGEAKNLKHSAEVKNQENSQVQGSKNQGIS